MAAGQNLPRAARIRNVRDIRAILRHGRRCPAGPLDVYFRENSADRPRVAVIVPKYGHPSVERNRLKRRIREIVRREWLARRWEEGAAIDLLVRARPSAYEMSYSGLAANLTTVLSGSG
jgi:ribonuclease P protein component